MAIHDHSRGVPRVINVICDNVLLSAFAANRRPASRDMVEEVCRDFDFSAESGPADSVTAIRVERVVPSASESISVFENACVPNASPVVDLPEEQRLFGTYAPKRRFSLFR
jgi:hypothetical protein